MYVPKYRVGVRDAEPVEEMVGLSPALLEDGPHW